MPRVRLFEIIGATIIMALTVFAGISCADEDNAAKLEGITWVLKSYGEPNDLKAAIPDHEPTLTFDKETKTVQGNGGVNGYGGDYKLDGSKMTISGLIHTMMASTDQALNVQEMTFFNILGSAESYEISGGELTITGSEGILVFTPQ
jgi:heat shock protein HslJ